MSKEVDDHNGSHANEIGDHHPDAASSGKKNVNCTSLGTDAIAKGYEAAGDTAIADKIRGMWGKTGFQIANELIKHGWTAYYYNPDTGNLYSGKLEPDGTRKKFNDHHYTSTLVNSNQGYVASLEDRPHHFHRVSIPVDPKNQIVNYDINVGDPDSGHWAGTLPATADQQAKYDQMMKEPFAFVVGPGGVHNAVLQNGMLTQIHWDSDDSDPVHHPLCQKTPFKTDWSRRWRSGVILVPPKPSSTGS